MRQEALTVALVSSSIVHISLVWWWWSSRPAGANEATNASGNSYQVLGKELPPEQVRDMQLQACDIDQTLLASEDPILANSPSANLHPFHRLLTRPTKTDKPGLLPYRKQPEEHTPTTITAPLFSMQSPPPPATGWTVNERHTEEFCSDACSNVSSSIVLSVEEAHKQSKPTWAPKPPKATWPMPMFQRTMFQRPKSIC